MSVHTNVHANRSTPSGKIHIGQKSGYRFITYLFIQAQLCPLGLAMKKCILMVNLAQTQAMQRILTTHHTGFGQEELLKQRDFVAAAVTSRHPAGKAQVRYEYDKTGLIWSWNFMIPKCWKNISNKSYRRDSIQGQAAGGLQKVL